MGMVSSQLEILGKRLKNLGIDAADLDYADVNDEARIKLEACIKEHQNILE